MTKDEILKLSYCQLQAAVAMKLGMVIYDRMIGALGRNRYLIVVDADDHEIPMGWKRIEDIASLPDRFLLTGEHWLVYLDENSGAPAYLMQLVAPDEALRDSYTSALIDLAKVDDSLVYYDGVQWADMAGLWRLISAPIEQHLRAFLIAKECPEYPSSNCV